MNYIRSKKIKFKNNKYKQYISQIEFNNPVKMNNIRINKLIKIFKDN